MNLNVILNIMYNLPKLRQTRTILPPHRKMINGKPTLFYIVFLVRKKMKL